MKLLWKRLTNFGVIILPCITKCHVNVIIVREMLRNLLIQTRLSNSNAVDDGNNDNNNTM